MDNLDQLLQGATQRIAEDYFLLPLADQPSVYRERVYCYELYHQLRCLWPENGHFTLNGEVDKAAHRLLRQIEGADKAKPDFLVHQPGHMAGNFAIMEVKHCDAPRRGIEKDLETLRLFTGAVGYKRGIYLIYGTDALELAAGVVAKIQGDDTLIRIQVWAHPVVGEAAFRVE